MSDSTTYNIDEIRQMITAIRGDDINAKLHAVSNLHVIAHSLGPLRTRVELLPYVGDSTDNSEEFWMKVAEKLAFMMEEVGGTKEVTSLLNVLRRACEFEDHNVQEPAISSIISLGNKISQDELSRQFFPFIKSLCDDMWHPMRSAASLIICSLFSQFSESDRSRLVHFFPPLASDQIPSVRRALIRSIPKLIQKNGILPILDLLTKLMATVSADDSQSVLIEVPILLESFGDELMEVKQSSVMKLLTSSKWQARMSLIDHINNIFPNNIPTDIIREIANSGLTDSFVGVRASIARQIPYIYRSNCFSHDSFEQFVSTLISDNEPSVRVCSGRSLSKLKGAPSDSMRKFILILLDDTDVSVKSAALEAISETGECFALLVPHISDIIQLYGWRQRVSVVNLLPKIAHTFDTTFFDQNLKNALISLISNESSEVRKATVKALKSIAAHYGATWTQNTVIPMLKKLSENSDYQIRQIAIEAMFELSVTPNCIESLKALCTDPVPNVRIVLARNAKQNRQNELLTILSKDTDSDVLFFTK